MSKLIDLTGQRFGRLVVLSKAKGSNWNVRCDCGTEKVVRGYDLRHGKTVSCGCYFSETNPDKLKMGLENVLFEGTNVSHLTNTASKNNVCGVRGVSFDPKTQTYYSRIFFQGRRYFLGRYKNLEDAKRAREKAEIELWMPVKERYENKHEGENDGD